MKNKKKMCFGVIIGTRAYFNSELAIDVRKQLLETLTKEGYDYVILPEDATPTGSSSCLLYTSPSPRDRQKSRMPSSA